MFSGAGGLDLGVEQAGFTVRACVEFVPERRRTLKLNQPKYMPKAVVVEDSGGDVTKLSTEAILERAGLKKGAVSLVFGGPPCQPFSKSAYWVPGRPENLLNDPRAAMLKEFARVVKEARPSAFLLENVFGLKYKTAKPALEALVVALKDAGYNVSEPTVLNAADYGVPQRRERTFVIGVIDGEKLHFPGPTHAPPKSVAAQVGSLKPYVTCQEAIGDLDDGTVGEGESVGGRWGHLLPEIPPGRNYLYYTSHEKHPKPVFEWRSRFWSFLLKLDPNEVSWTIQASPGPYIGPFHWRNRRLRISEIKRIQTFPDDYQLCGPKRTQWSQIGDAVPPLLGKAVAMSVREQLQLRHAIAAK